MSRLDRPLDRTAMRAADEQLYAAHESDVRPNSLFDANGNRKPLSVQNDSFAEEWKYYYRASLPQAGGENGKTSSATGQSPAVAAASVAPVAQQQPRNVGQVVTTCPRKHWIQIALTKLPDLQKRPDWWPERGEPNYPGEPFIADITDGRKKSKLSGSSDTRYDDIPAGECRIQFPTFYLEIEARFKKSKLGAGAKPMLPAKLELTKLDPYFAPGLEPLDIVYTIENLAGETVWCNIESTRDPGVTLFRHRLSGAELADATDKKLKWDGFATGGKLNGKWIDPAWSPYLVSLSVDDSSADYGGIESSKTTEVLIHKLVTDLSANARNRIILNTPETKVDAITEVLIRKKGGGSAVTPIEIDVLYTFARGTNPVTAAGSYAYSGAKTLGKLGDPSAVYWAPHAHCPSSSKDGYKNSCVAKAMTADPGRGIAAAYFIPSAVGGNRYTVKAQVLAAEDDKTVLAEDTSPEVTIWRKIKLDAYEMDGLDHVTKHGTTALIQPYFTPAFVEYELGTVTKIPARYSVQYIGLWDHATGKELDWNVVQAKTPAETPTAKQIAAALGPMIGPDMPATVAARAEIQVLANAWRNRLKAQYHGGLGHWAVDAGVPVNSMVAIDSEHPKYSANSPDWRTAEWTKFPWLRIHVEKQIIHPDALWVGGIGVSVQGRAYIHARRPQVETEETVAHEAAHETRNQFFRELFGPGDHSARPGLQDPSGTRHSFTAREVQVLRGMK